MKSFVEYARVGSLGFRSILGKNNKADSQNFHYHQKVDLMAKGVVWDHLGAALGETQSPEII